ncbi:hypothetical protein QWZ13_17380 [Reinekea marina]|nr:hypothetical protein [Reinekea marina]MDN3650681.1 hypothetical protein [Reinekea marina]
MLRALLSGLCAEVKLWGWGPLKRESEPWMAKFSGAWMREQRPVEVDPSS